MTPMQPGLRITTVQHCSGRCSSVWYGLSSVVLLGFQADVSLYATHTHHSEVSEGYSSDTFDIFATGFADQVRWVGHRCQWGECGMGVDLKPEGLA